MKERIIKDYDNMGMRCNYTVQMYSEDKKEWVYKKTYQKDAQMLNQEQIIKKYQ